VLYRFIYFSQAVILTNEEVTPAKRSEACSVQRVGSCSAPALPDFACPECSALLKGVKKIQVLPQRKNLVYKVELVGSGWVGEGDADKDGFCCCF
jgi:hypothetical protein